MKIYYNPILNERAKYLRKNSTPGEISLWKRIKSGAVFGLDFHRQKPIGNYIVDFYCSEMKLVIEIDGNTHFQREAYDKMRELEIAKLGITILKFGEGQARRNTDSIIMEIKEWVKERRKTHPAPARRGTPLDRGDTPRQLRSHPSCLPADEEG